MPKSIYKRREAVRFLFKKGAMTTNDVVEHMNGKGKGRNHYETNGYQMGTLLGSIKEITCVYRSRGSSGPQTLWDLKSEVRKEMLEDLEKQPKELKKQIRALKRAINNSNALLEKANDRILRLEGKKITSKQRLLITMNVKERMNQLLIILRKPHSTEELLEGYPKSRGTLLKDLEHLKQKGLLQSNRMHGQSGRGWRLMWSTTEHGNLIRVRRLEAHGQLV
jgi:hypothetical protein